MKKNTYFLNYKVMGNFSFYCNGILLEKISYERGLVEGIIYLNPLISKKGIHNISLLMMPVDTNNFIKPKEIEGNEIQIYYSENGETPPFKMIKNLALPDYSKPQNSILHAWDFEADVCYELENVLENASNLTKEDSTKLSEEIISFYHNLHEVLNTGNKGEYKEIFKESFIREGKSMYLNNEEIESYIYEMVQRLNSAKNNMKPLEKFTIDISPNNKIVKLLNSRNESPLYSVDKENNIEIFGFKLYRDKTTGKLEVY